MHDPTRARGPGLASSNGPNWRSCLTQNPTEHGWPTSLWTGRRVAELIALQLEEQAWDELVSTLESQHLLAELAAEARAEIAANATRDLDELL